MIKIQHLDSAQFHDIRRFRNKCDIVEEPSSSRAPATNERFLNLMDHRTMTHETLCFAKDMHQSESFDDVFHHWYDCQITTDIKFLNYSGNVY